ncbi:MAG: hypothetical protein AAF805_10730 [Planctomycetota bacterium]
MRRLQRPKGPEWLVPTLRGLVWPIVGAIGFAVVVANQWPIDSGDDLVALLVAGLAAMCVASPDTVSYYGSLRGGGLSSFTSREAASFRDDVVYRVVGGALLLGTLTGLTDWLVWDGWLFPL